MGIGINIHIDDDEDAGPLTHWLEDDDGLVISKKKRKKIKDEDITPFTHLTRD